MEDSASDVHYLLLAWGNSSACSSSSETLRFLGKRAFRGESSGYVYKIGENINRHGDRDNDTQSNPVITTYTNNAVIGDQQRQWTVTNGTDALFAEKKGGGLSR